MSNRTNWSFCDCSYFICLCCTSPWSECTQQQRSTFGRSMTEIGVHMSHWCSSLSNRFTKSLVGDVSSHLNWSATLNLFSLMPEPMKPQYCSMRRQHPLQKNGLTTHLNHLRMPISGLTATNYNILVYFWRTEILDGGLISVRKTNSPGNQQRRSSLKHLTRSMTHCMASNS